MLPSVVQEKLAEDFPAVALTDVMRACNAYIHAAKAAAGLKRPLVHET